MNMVPVVATSIICCLAVSRRYDLILIGCIAFFVLSSFPIMRNLKTQSNLHPDFEMASEIASRIKELLKGFVKAWWGFIVGTFILTVVHPLFVAMKISFVDCLASLMATTMLFGIYETMVTGWALTNVGNFRRGQFQYAMTLLNEFVIYNAIVMSGVISSFVSFAAANDM